MGSGYSCPNTRLRLRRHRQAAEEGWHFILECKLSSGVVADLAKSGVPSISICLYQYSFSSFCIPITRIPEAASIELTSVEIPPWDRSAIIEATYGGYYQVPLLVAGEDVVF